MTSFLKDFFWISFLQNHNTTFWYIIAIVILYILFPLVNKIINKCKHGKYYMILMIIADVLLNYTFMKINAELYKNIEIFLMRVPIFIYGTYLAKKVYDKEKFDKGFIIINLILIIMTIFLKTYNLTYKINNYGLISRYITSILAINLTVFISILLEYIQNNLINKGLEFFGNISLEIYLFHISFRGIFIQLKLYTSNIMYEIMMLICTIIFSLIFKYVYDKIQNKLKSIALSNKRKL